MSMHFFFILTFKTFQSSEPYFSPNEKSYIVLRPVIVPLSTDWSKRIAEYFDYEDLHYIGSILLQLEQEGRHQLTLNLDIDDYHEDNASSSASPDAINDDQNECLQFILRIKSKRKFDSELSA